MPSSAFKRLANNAMPALIRNGRPWLKSSKRRNEHTEKPNLRKLRKSRGTHKKANKSVTLADGWSKSARRNCVDNRKRPNERKRVRRRSSSHHRLVRISRYTAYVTVHAKLILIDIPGELDTTVRLKYMLARYPQLTTPGALQTFMSSTFGPVDGDSIVLTLRSPKKKATAKDKLPTAEDKPPPPPKYAVAAVPFKTISDAHAAVCASCRADRGLDEFEITWMEKSEPAVWSWAERMLKSKEKEQRGATTTTTVPAMPAPAGGARDVGDDAPVVFPANTGNNNARGGLPQDSGAQSSPATNPQFSSFPSSFVRSRILPFAYHS
jgi:hypothetical protein